MRHPLIAAVVAVCLSGVAAAQSGSMLGIEWEEMPPAGAFSRAYPPRALEVGVPGYTLMCCRVLPNRRLECDVAGAWPSDQGFDEAGSQVMRQFRMSEATFAASPSDARVRTGIVWRTGASTPELDAGLAQIHEATKNICTPTGTEAAPGIDDIVVTVERHRVRDRRRGRTG